MSYNYYLNRNKTRIIVIDGQESSASGSVDVMYSYYPENMENNTDSPEIQDRFHLAIVHGVLSKLFGDKHHESMYRSIVAEARDSSKNSAFAQLAQYDY